MPTIGLDYGERTVEANEYAALICMFMLIDEAKKHPFAAAEREALDNVERWFTHKARGGPLFIFRIDRMLEETRCPDELFLRFVRLGISKAKTCGEWLERDYVN